MDLFFFLSQMYLPQNSRSSSGAWMVPVGLGSERVSSGEFKRFRVPLSSSKPNFDTQGPGGGKSKYGEFWELHDLRKVVNVITAQEFVDREKDNLKVPRNVLITENESAMVSVLPIDNDLSSWARLLFVINFDIKRQTGSTSFICG